MILNKGDKMGTKKLDDKDFIRYKMFEAKKPLLRKYTELVIGSVSLFKLIKYEILTTFIGPIPGALGLLLRKLFYPFLFKNAGRGIVWGKSIILRHPDKIQLGNRVVIDDYALIDARGSGDKGIYIGDNSIIGRSVTIQAKVDAIHIGKQTNIGAGTAISSQGGIIIGDYVNIAGGCSIAGGAYQVGRDTASIREHGKHTKGPIRIDKKCRLGRASMVLDGAHLREGTIVGALSMVKGEIPEYSVVAGIPAKVLYRRN
jgi:acetyltransferase-like isoleucine patch superfamily enzyme